MIYTNEQLRRGEQEGRGIFKTIGKWLKSGNKWLKKTKVISKAGPVIGSLVGKVYPQAGQVITGASKFAKQHGYGPPRRCKSITRAQVEAMRQGHGRVLKGGGISLASARRLISPVIKNITPAQVRALRSYFGRWLKGGGISLSGGGPSGYYAVTSTAPDLKGHGTTLPGGGIKLAGQGKRKRKRKTSKGVLHY